MVLQALRRRGVDNLLIHTGQHYDFEMSEIFFKELDLPAPDYHLGIGGGTQGLQTGRMLVAIEAVLSSIQPDTVIVYGDTNSTLAGALAAAKLNIPVAHVEAGLRSFKRTMPEEINRIVADHVSDMLFAPTPLAVRNLVDEGLDATKIFQTGDVMYDGALQFGPLAEQSSDVLLRLRLHPKAYVLVTLHRAENTDDSTRLRLIANALICLAKEVSIVLPLHPRTRNRLQKAGIFLELLRSVQVIGPLGYLDMVMLEKNAALVATDSGGVQKEAFFYGSPCITFRNETEWMELVEIGWNRLLPATSSEQIVAGVHEALSWKPHPAPNPYGDGNSSKRIAGIITELGMMKVVSQDDRSSTLRGCRAS